MLLITNSSVRAVQAPLLPTPQNSNSALTPLEEPVFKAPGTLTTRQISGQDTILQFLQQIRQPDRIDNVVASHLAGKPLNTKQLSMLGALRSMTFDPLQALLYQIGLAIVFFILVVVILKLLWRFKSGISSLNTQCCCIVCRAWPKPQKTRSASYTELQVLSPPPYRSTTTDINEPATFIHPTTRLPTVLAIEEEDELAPLSPRLDKENLASAPLSTEHVPSCSTPCPFCSHPHPPLQTVSFDKRSSEMIFLLSPYNKSQTTVPLALNMPFFFFDAEPVRHGSALRPHLHLLLHRESQPVHPSSLDS